MHLYQWDRCFIIHAKSYALDRRDHPYRRLSVTVILADCNRFTLGVNGQPAGQYAAAILAPNIRRDFIEIVDDGITIIDVGVTMPAYSRLVSQLPRGEIKPLATATVAQLRAATALLGRGVISCEEARQMFEAVVDMVTRNGAPPHVRDPRIQRVLDTVEGLSLDELSAARLSQIAQVSSPRLRALFREQLNCTPSQYLRWASAYKIAGMWQRGVKLTDIAHAAGFYDLAHADRVVKELIGMSPSMLIDPRITQLHRC